eukprot:gnl/Chilomastix_cuspidata/3648.p1 GENE.gnl/Chilomastix_cuspidata/3648~~gnl/Chilomastix_cuspidata/3648.p1  ORF type:complete len:180 (-),score=50.37 gnl/Chilomastix_cuspidata/3648:61-600(-)
MEEGSFPLLRKLGWDGESQIGAAKHKVSQIDNSSLKFDLSGLGFNEYEAEAIKKDLARASEIRSGSSETTVQKKLEVFQCTVCGISFDAAEALELHRASDAHRHAQLRADMLHETALLKAGRITAHEQNKPALMRIERHLRRGSRPTPVVPARSSTPARVVSKKAFSLRAGGARRRGKG